MAIDVISFEDMIIPDFEKDEDYESLKNSIKEQGILHNPTVRRVNGKYEVVAGYNRHRLPCYYVHNRYQRDVALLVR